jgi:hypothetical protein
MVSETIDGRKGMLKSIMAIFALFTIIIAVSLEIVAAETEVTMDAIYVPVGRIVLAPPVGVTPKRSAVAFPHSRHFDYTCKTCHHKWDGNSQVQSCTASKCHDQPSARVKDKKTPEEGLEAIRYFKYAYHRQCIGCHRKIKDPDRKLERSRKNIKEQLQWPGPTSYEGCHPKE